MADIKLLLAWTGGPSWVRGVSPDLSLTLPERLKASPHPSVRKLGNETAMLAALRFVLRLHFDSVGAHSPEDDRWIVAQRLDEVLRAVKRARKAVQKVPRTNSITAAWVAALDRIEREAGGVRPEKRSQRRTAALKRRTLLHNLMSQLLYRQSQPRIPLTREPRGFAAEVAEVVCALAGLSFPSDDKERRLLLDETFRAIEKSDPNVKTAPVRSTSPRRSRRG